VRRGPDRQRLPEAGQPADPCRPGTHPVRDPRPVQQPGVDHRGLDDRQRRLQPGHSHRRGVPLAVLGLDRVRRVVGGDGVDRAVGQPGAQGGDVGRGAQRRVDLEHRVVADGRVVGEHQVVRGDLGGDRDAPGLRLGDDPDRPGGGDVADVQPRPDVLDQQRVAGDDRLLGDPRPPGQAQASRHLALVQLRAAGQPGVLCVLGDHPVEGAHVLQGTAHQQRVVDADAVVGEHPHSRGAVRHRTELGQLGSTEPDGDGADRLDVHQPGLTPEPPDLLDDAGGVGDRGGVGHREHGDITAQGRGGTPGGHRLGVLAARLAQVGVQIHQTRQGDQAGAVDYLRACGTGRARRLASADHRAVEHQVHGRSTEWAHRPQHAPGHPTTPSRSAPSATSAESAGSPASIR